MPDLPCANCVRLQRRLDEAVGVVNELWRQNRLRDQLRTGNFDNEPMPPLSNLLAGELLDEAA